MPIDVERKFLFIHIPKTGGTSINKYLNLCEDNPLYGSFTAVIAKNGPTAPPTYELPMWKQHFTPIELFSYSYNHADPALYVKMHDFFKFSFVRNPWDREVSNLFWMKKTNLIKKDATLKEYFSYVISCQEHWHKAIESGTWKPDHKCRAIATILTHCKPMQVFIDDTTPGLKINFIGRFENLLDDMQTICEDHLDIPFNPEEFPWEKKATNKKHYTEYYDDETREMVEVANKKLIERFNYKFGD